MKTLHDLIRVHQRLGRREAIVWCEGFRTWTLSHREVCDAIARFAGFLDSAGVTRGDRVLIFGENRPEWVVAFWASVARGVQVVPVDYRFSIDLVRRIADQCRPVLLVQGDPSMGQSPVRTISFDDMRDLPEGGDIHYAPVTGDDIVEIVYTSGTTGEPKPVVHRHRNIVANLEPVAKEISRYRNWARPFQPIRILNLLPLSHMFGQSLGLYIPLLLEGSIVFTDEMSPWSIIDTARRQRVSVVVSVPRIAENLRHEVERRFDLGPAPKGRGWPLVAKRWWRYRRVHARFGWKFWCFVVGGAPTPPDLESFWSQLGFVVVQGYGLTETSPVVAVNHPFRARRGSLGKPIAGTDVRIAGDGEILVRGPAVVGEADREGWFHTGDIGQIDADGRLYYRGRKKDVIVTPEGMNVYPEDVEAALHSVPGIRDCVVVGVHDEVQAALILEEPGGDGDAAVRQANLHLEAHQRIRHWSVWPEEDFPRTPSTMKVKRYEVAARIAQGLRPSAEASAPLPPDLTALSSLERVDLLAELEQRYQIELDEASFENVQTREELDTWIEQSKKGISRTSPTRVSHWSMSPPVRLLGRAIQRVLVLPLFRHYVPLEVRGLANLEHLEAPVIFAANHTSHLDTPAVLAALPSRWRRSVAPAVRQEQFRALFDREHSAWWEVLWAGIQYVLAGLIFNAYPLPGEMAGVRHAMRRTGDLVSRGACPLIFPEGKRTSDGKMNPFRPGAALMAAQLRLPVVPLFLEGLYEIYSIHDAWPKRGPARVSFGKPLRFPPRMDHAEIARRIEEAVRQLSPQPQPHI